MPDPHDVHNDRQLLHIATDLLRQLEAQQAADRQMLRHTWRWQRRSGVALLVAVGALVVNVALLLVQVLRGGAP